MFRGEYLLFFFFPFGILWTPCTWMGIPFCRLRKCPAIILLNSFSKYSFIHSQVKITKICAFFFFIEWHPKRGWMPTLILPLLG